MRLRSEAFIAICQDVDGLLRKAKALGVRGEPYTHYQTQKGRFTGKTTVRYKPLNNLDLFVLAKLLHGVPINQNWDTEVATAARISEVLDAKKAATPCIHT